MTGLDETHDPERRSSVASANAADNPFPIQNLPLGIFAPGSGTPRIGIAIGDAILDVPACVAAGLLDLEAELVAGDTLNTLFARGNDTLLALRRQAGHLLDADGVHVGRLGADLLHAAGSCTMSLPVHIGDYTDYYAGIYHARAAGALLMPENPLPRNYKWVPIAYHGRASSIRLSGGTVSRPNGQLPPEDGAAPEFGPTRRLDLELELGLFVGRGSVLGQPVPIDRAAEHVAGFCLLNDWSARDVQLWEMVPLGPFLSKNFGTTISPWVLTAEALKPFRVGAMARGADDPPPLNYLRDEVDQAAGGLGVALEVRLCTARMRAEYRAPEVIITSDARHLYWTPAQMIAHHASGGCDLRPGDLIGTGTISGPTPDQLSSLLELTGGGRHPFTLSTGESRTFLEDEDLVEISGWCRRDGFRSIGFGVCSGTVGPASPAGARPE